MTGMQMVMNDHVDCQSDSDNCYFFTLSHSDKLDHCWQPPGADGELYLLIRINFKIITPEFLQCFPYARNLLDLKIQKVFLFHIIQPLADSWLLLAFVESAHSPAGEGRAVLDQPAPQALSELVSGCSPRELAKLQPQREHKKKLTKFLLPGMIADSSHLKKQLTKRGRYKSKTFSRNWGSLQINAIFFLLLPTIMQWMLWTKSKTKTTFGQSKAVLHWSGKL